MASSQPCVLVRGSISQYDPPHRTKAEPRLNPSFSRGTTTTTDIDEFYFVNDIVRPGQTIAARSLTKRLGGKGGNQAKAIACAGVSVLLDGAVGDDAEGAAVKKVLCEAIEGSEGRIVGDRIKLIQGVPTGKAVIQLADDGENCISEFFLLSTCFAVTTTRRLTK